MTHWGARIDKTKIHLSLEPSLGKIDWIYKTPPIDYACFHEGPI